MEIFVSQTDMSTPQVQRESDEDINMRAVEETQTDTQSQTWASQEPNLWSLLSFLDVVETKQKYTGRRPVRRFIRSATNIDRKMEVFCMCGQLHLLVKYVAGDRTVSLDRDKIRTAEYVGRSHQRIFPWAFAISALHN